MMSIDKQSSSNSGVATFAKRRNHYYKNNNNDEKMGTNNNEMTKNNDDANNNKNNIDGSGSSEIIFNSNDNNKKQQQLRYQLRHGNNNNKDCEDSYSAYRRLCELRMRRLERYKKTRSFCSLHDESGGADGSTSEATSANFSSSNCAIHPSNNSDQDDNQIFAPSRGQQLRGRSNCALDKSARVTSSSCSQLNVDASCFENGRSHNNCLLKTQEKAQVPSTLSALFYPTSSSLSYSPDITESERTNTARLHSQLQLLVMTPAVEADSIFVDSEEPAPAKEFHHGALKPTLCRVCTSSPINCNHYYYDEHADYTATAANGSKNNKMNTTIEQRPSPLNLQFEILREKMISIMENDVQLLKKLLALGETIQEIRSVRTTTSTAQASTAKIDSDASQMREQQDAELTDEWRPMKKPNHHLTTVYVGSDADAENDAYLGANKNNSNNSSVQYFSRKNSVLRIPIPPRSSNRMLGKKAALKPSELFRHPKGLKFSNKKPAIQQQQQSDATDEDSGNSSASNAPSAQCSPYSVAVATATSTSCTTTMTSCGTPTTSYQQKASGTRATSVKTSDRCDAIAAKVREPGVVAHTEMAICALRSELKANLIESSKRNKSDSTVDSGRSTLIQYSSCSSSSSSGGSDCASVADGSSSGSSRYSTFSSESFLIAATDSGDGNVILEEANYDSLNDAYRRANGAKTIVINMDEKCGEPYNSIRSANVDIARIVS